MLTSCSIDSHNRTSLSCRRRNTHSNSLFGRSSASMTVDRSSAAMTVHESVQPIRPAQLALGVENMQVQIGTVIYKGGRALGSTTYVKDIYSDAPLFCSYCAAASFLFNGVQKLALMRDTLGFSAGSGRGGHQPKLLRQLTRRGVCALAANQYHLTAQAYVKQ
eukprot:1196150-Prorocentrum_minimum.AAC.2